MALVHGEITEGQYWLMKVVLYHKASGGGNWSGILKQAFLNNKWDIVLSVAPGGRIIKGNSKILVKGSKNIVDISKFSNGKYKSWRLVKDYAAGKNTAHRGSYWKLYNTADRSYSYHTLTRGGKYLRTKK